MSVEQVWGRLAPGIRATTACAKCGHQVFLIAKEALAHHTNFAYRQWDALICQGCGYTEFYDVKAPHILDPATMHPSALPYWQEKFFVLDRRGPQGPYR